MMINKTVAIILGRKGSSGIRNKNTMNILGRPAYLYSLLAAKNSKYIDKIFISTDHEVIIESVKTMDVSIISRPEYLCTNMMSFVYDNGTYGIEITKRIFLQ